MTGTRVGHYVLGEPLGEGGMASVYRADDERLGRQVAVKFLQPAVAADPDNRARLLREARAALSLSSSRIAAIYDIGEHEGQVFIVMELVEGEPLSTRLERGPLPIPEAIDVAMQVADALDEAHGRGIVHRDIKSANIMVDPRGRVKVLDFGLAKFLDPLLSGTAEQVTSLRTFRTVQGTLLGTFSYMAPEQALGRPVDGRSDVFSLGVVMYEMVAGRLPFEGVTPTEVIDRVLHHEPAPLGSVRSDAPPALADVVARALAKDPNQRYPSARDLFVDLQALSRTLGGLEPPAEDWRDAAPGAARHASVAIRRSSAAARLERSVAVMAFTNITGDPTDEWIGAGIAETVTADLQKLRGLTVIGRAQVFEATRNLLGARAAEFDERLTNEVGRHVGATWIVGGGFQRMGPTIRITAHFVDVATGRVLRTVKVDGRIDDIFDLQDKIVLELGQGLHLDLAAGEVADIGRDETTSVAAYEAYSRGMMNLRMATREAMDHAIAQFERALEIDPRYAMAWAGLGSARELKGSLLGIPDLVWKGIEALQKAIEIDPTLPSAYHRLASAYLGVGHYDEAIGAARHAIRLDPVDAGGHGTLARAYWIGKGMLHEGIEELEHAIRLNPENGYGHLQLSLLYSLQRDFTRAETAARRAIELQERYLSGTEGLHIVGAHLRLGYVFYLRGEYEEAIREYEREMAFVSSGDHLLRERTTIEAELKMAAAYWRAGDRENADRFFDRAVAAFNARRALGTTDAATAYYVAAAHGLRGDAAAAARHLAESFRPRRALNVTRARLDPDFEPVRDSAEVRAVLDAVVAGVAE